MTGSQIPEIMRVSFPRTQRPATLLVAGLVDPEQAGFPPIKCLPKRARPWSLGVPLAGPQPALPGRALRAERPLLGSLYAPVSGDGQAARGRWKGAPSMREVDTVSLGQGSSALRRGTGHALAVACFMVAAQVRGAVRGARSPWSAYARNVRVLQLVFPARGGNFDLDEFPVLLPAVAAVFPEARQWSLRLGLARGTTAASRSPSTSSPRLAARILRGPFSPISRRSRRPSSVAASALLMYLTLRASPARRRRS